nr:inositol monophosphatase family protein [Acuticoccus mangrovi]
MLVEAVRTAGTLARRFFDGDVKSWMKDDASPVSEADIAVDQRLSEILRAARPGYGWLSEELGFAGEGMRTFVVDPIDGTRAFLRKERAWSVVAAVVERGRPVAAAVFEPMRDACYTATVGTGAFRNGERLHVSMRTSLDGAQVALPGPLYRDGGFREAGVERCKWIPSLALRLARVGEGRIDGCVTKQGPHHWDLAAADLIVHEAGGTLTTLTGTVLRYDTDATSHGPAVAGPLGLVDALRRLAVAHESRAA